MRAMTASANQEEAHSVDNPPSRRDLFVLLIGLLLPSLVVNNRLPPGSSWQTFVYSPFWIAYASYSGTEVYTVGLFPTFAYWAANGRVEPITTTLLVLGMMLITGLWKLRSGRATIMPIKVLLALNFVPSIYLVLMWLPELIARRGIIGPGYYVPLPLLPILGAYFANKWKMYSPPKLRGEIDCPTCRLAFKTPDDGVKDGDRVTCPRCGSTLRIVD